MNFTVDYSQATDDSSLVTKATCTLYAIGEDDVIATTATETLEATPTEDALNVVFAKDELASGCYQALINLYSGDVVVGYWVEVVQISDSMTSGGTITFDGTNCTTTSTDG